MPRHRVSETETILRPTAFHRQVLRTDFVHPLLAQLELETTPRQRYPLLAARPVLLLELVRVPCSVLHRGLGAASAACAVATADINVNIHHQDEHLSTKPRLAHLSQSDHRLDPEQVAVCHQPGPLHIVPRRQPVKPALRLSNVHNAFSAACPPASLEDARDLRNLCQTRIK